MVTVTGDTCLRRTKFFRLEGTWEGSRKSEMAGHGERRSAMQSGFWTVFTDADTNSEFLLPIILTAEIVGYTLKVVLPSFTSPVKDRA